MRISIKNTDLPVPVSDHINKIQFRVVNENRNIVSDWSVINFVKQETLVDLGHETLPPITDPGDVLVVLPTPADGWESGFRPIESILPDTLVYEDYGALLPPGGDATEVLTKIGPTDYDVEWLPPEGGGGIEDVQDGNLVIAMSCFA